VLDRRARLPLVAALLAAATGCSLLIEGDRFADRNRDAGNGANRADAGDGDGGDSDGSESDAGEDAGRVDAAPPPCSGDCGECSDGCCTERCGAAPDCRLECDAECDCRLDCRASDEECQAVCRRSDCVIDCRGVDKCKPRCEMESECRIDCTNARDCKDAECIAGSSCLLDCSGADTCEFKRCDGPVVSCRGGVLACNRDCPP
jgi:hypothetical protein